MPTVRLRRRTTLTPDQIVAGLTAFGHGAIGATSADVTEGSRLVWECLHYDWFHPDRVLVTTVDSNVYGGNSGYMYTWTRCVDGTTEVCVDIVREGKTLLGNLLSWGLALFGRGLLQVAFAECVQAIEARRGSSIPGHPLHAHPEPLRHMHAREDLRDIRSGAGEPADDDHGGEG